MAKFQLRQDLSAITLFPTFPFRLPVVPNALVSPAPELVRPGDAGSDECEFCVAADDEFVWTDDDWRLRLHRPSALLGTVVLHTRAHWESFCDLPDDLASRFGPLCARIERAILGLGDVGRVHLYRSGDGHAHFHVRFLARPRGFQQFRGVFLLTWAELLTHRSEAEVVAAGEAIARALARG